jgi:hypothetical protein
VPSRPEEITRDRFTCRPARCHGRRARPGRLRRQWAEQPDCNPEIPADLAAEVTNPCFPLVPGTRYDYAGEAA